MALALQSRMEALTSGWRKRGFALDFGIGIDQGYATLGTIGFPAKHDYVAVGSVVIVAAGLCARARGGQILIARRVHAALDDQVEATSSGEVSIAGVARPVAAIEVRRSASRAPFVSARVESAGGSLSERELEVAALIAQGASNRDIARRLIIADATAVRHVANILSKLDFHSRAQIAVWAVQNGLPTAAESPDST